MDGRPGEPSWGEPDEPLFGIDESDSDDGARPADAESRWPWLVGLALLSVLSVSAVVWLLASLPHPAPARSVATAAPTSSPPSTLDDTASAWPTTVSMPAPVGTTREWTPPAITPAEPFPRPVDPTRPPPTTRPRTTPPLTPRPPTSVLVPNVVGLRQSTATAILRGAGFRVSAITVAYPSSRSSHRVIAQSPLGGSSAAWASTVTIFVGASY